MVSHILSEACENFCGSSEATIAAMIAETVQHIEAALLTLRNR